MSFFDRADLVQNSDQETLHNLLLLPPQDSASSPYLRPGVANILSRTPLIVLSNIDTSGRPWATIWEGEHGFTRATGDSQIVIRANIDRLHDPVAETLVGTEPSGDVFKDDQHSKRVSILGINLEEGTQINIYGTMVSGTLAESGNRRGEIMLVIKVEQSFISHTEYIIPKRVVPNALIASLVPKNVPPSQELIITFSTRAQIFFVASTERDSNLKTGFRSGPPGFVQIETNTDGCFILSYPAHSGIRLYETLPNGSAPTKAALLFPDFHNGNLLYISGTLELLMREDVVRVLPQRNVAISIKTNRVRIVENAMAFRAFPDFQHQPSPFAVQHVRWSQSPKLGFVYAKVISTQFLTPTIARLRFRTEDSPGANQWKPGQYVTLGFEPFLREQPSYTFKPSSKNDDPQDTFNRKFTVSSGFGHLSSYCEFEITIRNVGLVTQRLHRSTDNDDLSILLRGFNGGFIFRQDGQEFIGVIAGGIGVTPLLSQASTLDLPRVCVFWTIKAEDLGLVLDSYEREPRLRSCTRLFVTGDVDAPGRAKLAELRSMDAWVEERRMQKDDLGLGTEAGRAMKQWYICTSAALRHTLLGWLKGRNVIFETFTY